MPIRVITQRDPNSGSLPSFSRTVKAGFVGISGGANTLIQNAVTELTGSDGTVDTFTTNSVVSIQRVSPNPSDSINVYDEGLDYNFTSPDKITWLNNSLGVPELEGELGTDGTGWDTKSMGYKICSTGTDGTTLGSNIVILKSTSATQSHILNWTKVAFATGYELYRQTSGAGNWYRQAVIANPNTTTYEFILESADTTTQIPTVCSAHRRPATDSTYYVDYTKVTFDLDVKNFTSLNQVQRTHGIGSEITNMARIGFQQFGIDQMYIVATDGTGNQDFFDAVDKLSAVDDRLEYIFALKDSTAVADYVVQHARVNSSDLTQKERFGVVHIPNNIIEVGNSTTAGTILYRLNSFNNEKRAIIVIPNGNVMYMNSYQETDGTETENKLIGNYFVAGAFAFAAVTADDVATSVINRTLPGFNFGSAGVSWIDSVEKDKIEAAGGSYIYSKNGTPVIYNDNTNDTSSTENAERSCMSAEDEMRRRLREAHDQYKGRKITNGLFQALYSTTTSVMNLMVGDTLINSFNEGSLEIAQDDNVKTRVNIVFSYGEVYSMKELVFKYSFDL
jgi:hypothetical protein